MCFGGSQPKAPKIVYEGPSDAEISANRAALEQYQSQMQTQQEQFQSQLQAQIDAANKETEDLRAKYETEIQDLNAKNATELDQANEDAAAAVNSAKSTAAGQIGAATAAGMMQQVGSYSVGATESDPLENQKTTAVVKKKEKPKNTLKITQSGLASTAGTGLNIGV